MQQQTKEQWAHEPVLFVCKWVECFNGLVVQPRVHKKAVHVCTQHPRAHQVLEPKAVQILPRHKLKVVVHNRLLVVLQLVCDSVEVTAPLGRRAKRRYKVRHHLRLLAAQEKQARVREHGGC